MTPSDGEAAKVCPVATECLICPTAVRQGQRVDRARNFTPSSSLQKRIFLEKKTNDEY